MHAWLKGCSLARLRALHNTLAWQRFTQAIPWLLLVVSIVGQLERIRCCTLRWLQLHGYKLSCDTKAMQPRSVIDLTARPAGSSALPRSTSTPILSVESSPDHNPGPVTTSQDLQVMSPRGANLNSLGRAISKSRQNVRPEDVPVSSSIPARERDGVTVI